MKNLRLTELEKQVLRNFVPTQSVYDYAENVKNINNISMDIFDNERELVLPSTLKGVVGSLCKKGVLMSDDFEQDGSSFIYLCGSFADNQDAVDELMKIVID